MTPDEIDDYLFDTDCGEQRLTNGVACRLAAQLCGRLDELIEVLKSRPTSAGKHEEPVIGRCECGAFGGGTCPVCEDTD
jgi:hypothetical protein